MADVRASGVIDGVLRVTLTPFADERGRFVETFRREWFPDRSWDQVQTNRSDSKRNVLRGLHFHRRQIDFWVPAAGRIRVGLVDLRPGSPTHRRVELFDLDAASPEGVYVPVGVAHGFLALTDCTLTYVVDRYYDGSDELGVAWNDPELAVPWGIEDPILSPRDRANRSLAQLTAADLPD